MECDGGGNDLAPGGYASRCTRKAATKTDKMNCGRCGYKQVVQTKCACICVTCGANQDALPEQDTQIQEAVKVQRNGVP